MALRLDNFEQKVEPVILQRGKRFFRSGKVTEYTNENGEVQATIVDSEHYKVRMDIEEDGTIRYHSCTCPDEDAILCKHEVAVLYYLLEQRKKVAQEAHRQDLIAQMRQPQQSLWEEALDSLLTPLQASASSAEPQDEPQKERMFYMIEPLRERYKVLPVQVRKANAYLSIERKNDRLFFSSNVRLDKKGISALTPCIIKESSTSYTVIELTEFEQKVYSTLLRLGSVPKEAEPKLMQFISAARGQIDIHSNLQDFNE